MTGLANTLVERRPRREAMSRSGSNANCLWRSHWVRSMIAYPQLAPITPRMAKIEAWSSRSEATSNREGVAVQLWRVSATDRDFLPAPITRAHYVTANPKLGGSRATDKTPGTGRRCFSPTSNHNIANVLRVPPKLHISCRRETTISNQSTFQRRA